MRWFYTDVCSSPFTLIMLCMEGCGGHMCSLYIVCF